MKTEAKSQKSVYGRFAAALRFAVSSSILPHASFAQGPLTPPGAPAPTMKTLQQVEARTPISSATNITQAGSYYLTGNINVASNGDVITISADNVTLDLNGFRVSSSALANPGSAILITGSGLHNISIRNGQIDGNVLFSKAFSNGIAFTGDHPKNVRVTDVSVNGCNFDGINVGTNRNTVVENCTVNDVGGRGIVASTIKACTATECVDTAIAGDQVSDCHGQSSGNGSGVSATAAQNCRGSSAGNGIGVSALIAQNCRGSGIGGPGVSAITVQNCSGTSMGNFGIVATTAQNCSGTSGTGIGVFADNAGNCSGTSDSGTGLHAARIAVGCSGRTRSAAAKALDSGGTASYCSGENTAGGTAIEAVIGIGCVKFAGTNNITSVFLGTVSP